MERRMSIAEAVRHFEQAERWFARDLRWDVDRAIDDGLEEARRRSSGRYSLTDLARMDHPYARRHGSPRLDPSVINSQSGVFRSAWRGDNPMATDGAVSGRIFNDSAVADYLDKGTRTMFARPIGAAVEETVRPRMFRLAEDSAQELEKRYG